MKYILTSKASLIFLLTGLVGCNSVGSKTGSISYIYGLTAIISFILLIGCIKSVHKKRFWFITLFSSVFIVNTGYTLLSVSSDLQMALWCNRLSYLGSVFLPFSMLMIIVNVTNTPYKKSLPVSLSILAFAVFLITASPGILPIYYKEVTFKVIDGVSTLIKVYGPLHSLYLFYLLGYFSTMIAVILNAQKKKTIDTTAHAFIIAMAVFINIGVWFIEQLVDINFEILSISYIISEMFLLGIHLVINENSRLKELVRQVESVQNYNVEEPALQEIMLEKTIEVEPLTSEQIELYVSGLSALTPTEKMIYEAHIARSTTKEIMASMNIKETTLKYHNRNIYSKLGVSNRKELLEMHKNIKSIKSKITNTK